MAVDLGDTRTGVAVSDESGKFAFPRTVINERNREKRLKKIADAARNANAGKLIVGYPKNMNGEAGDRARLCAEDARELANLTALPTELWDERCTTLIAQTELRAAGTPGRKKRGIIDAAAAVKILESYLRYLELNPGASGEPPAESV